MECGAGVCNLCGSGEATPYAEGLPHLVRCSGCGLVRVAQLPGLDRLEQVYSADYFRNESSHVVGYADYEQDKSLILRTSHRRLARLEVLRPRRGRLLDIGCAFGFFLQAANRRGWEVEGIDLSSHAVDYARRDLGDDAVRCGQLESAGYEPASFDLITLWDVVEHFTDPREKLAYCRELLRDDGLLVLSTPDAGSLAARLTGSHWMGFKLAEEHLYYFSRKTMHAMLERAGFEPVETFQVGKDVALELFAARLRLYAPPLAALVERVVRRAGRGRSSVYVNPRDIMCVVARKRR
ncbi:MAG: class I SAM-dependent methyltransferase [Tepidiformaceae bacterium]